MPAPENQNPNTSLRKSAREDQKQDTLGKAPIYATNSLFRHQTLSLNRFQPTASRPFRDKKPLDQSQASIDPLAPKTTAQHAQPKSAPKGNRIILKTLL